MVAPTRSRSWPGLLGQLIAGTDLDAHDATWAMDEVMSGLANPGAVGRVRGSAAHQGRDSGRR